MMQCLILYNQAHRPRFVSGSCNSNGAKERKNGIGHGKEIYN